MENFTPLSAVSGGILIGLAATTLLVTQGRIAGISGIMGGLLKSTAEDKSWRIFFLLGLIIGASAFTAVGGADASDININPYQFGDNIHFGALIVGGLLVGYGTQTGSGCTSGHGVCGLGRFSTRSLVATLTFLAIAGITVFVIRTVTGG